MLLDYAISDGEAKARAASDAFGGEERIVNFCDIVRVDSDAIVRHLNRQQIFFTISRCQHNSPVAVGNRITRIQNQVGKHLLQLYGVAMNPGKMFVVLANNFDLAPAQLWFEQLQGVVEHAMNVERSELSRAAGARKIQKIV